jgi:hypothetical protein
MPLIKEDTYHAVKRVTAELPSPLSELELRAGTCCGVSAAETAGAEMQRTSQRPERVNHASAERYNYTQYGYDKLPASAVPVPGHVPPPATLSVDDALTHAYRLRERR